MATSYSTDIRPKFTAHDLGCMTPRGIRLDDPAWMCAPGAAFGFADHGNARHVFERLNGGGMPPGRPWPQAWLDTYQAWMTEGFSP